MTTIIDLSRIPLPNAIAPLSFEEMYGDFVERFQEYWETARATDPALPPYDTLVLETDPVAIVGEAWSYLRLLDRARINDVLNSLLAPRATGADLDNIVARQNIERLVTVPATDTTPAVMETDAQLLRRYLLSFERANAGSANSFLYQAFTAWPGMLDARVNGRAIHGRTGDTDIVIIGPDGRLPTAPERAQVRAAVTDPSVQPEAIAVTVLDAGRAEYTASLMIEVPHGPDPELVRLEAVARVTKAAEVRVLIGGEVPSGYLAGAAYGESIIRVHDLAPVNIAPDPYVVPVMIGLTITVEVRS